MYSQQKAELEKELADRDGVSVAIESAITFINLFSAISGNVLVCWTIIKYPRLRNTANIFIACLSLSDVLLAALGFPLTLAVLLTGRWPFDKPACTFQGFVHITEVSVLLPHLLNTDIKGTEPSVHITEVSFLPPHLLNKDIKGTESSVHITEASVLLPHLLNKDIKETEPSVHITEVSVLPPHLLNKDIKETEPSIHITEASVLLSHLINKDIKETEPSVHIT